MIVLETNEHILDSKCQTLVCPISNAGIYTASKLEKGFVDKFDGLRASVSRAAMHGVLISKGIHCFNAPNNQKIILVPVAKLWKSGAKIELIEKALVTIVNSYKGFGVTSLAIPYLGYKSNNDSITKQQVEDLIKKYLADIDLEVTIHLPT